MLSGYVYMYRKLYGGVGESGIRQYVRSILGCITSKTARTGGWILPQRMLQANVDIGVFQGTKVTERIYTRDSSGYRVVLSEATIAHSGGVAVLY